MGRRIIALFGAAALLLGLLLAVGACENPLLGTVQQLYTSFHSKLVQANFSSPNAKQFWDGTITVNFTDQSIGDIAAYDWDFGDTGSSSLPNPSHTYYSEGYFTVSLTVTGPDGSSTETKENFVAAYSGTPLVDIYEPDNTDWVTGTVAVQANADFLDPIFNVQFYVNNSFQETDYTSPYAYSWDTSGETENVWIPLKAVANTDGGPSGTDDDTAVRVDRTPPAVTLTAPAGGNVNADVTLTASASDTYSGMDRVEFYTDGSRRSTDSAAPYSYTWDARYQSEGGSHTLLARAFDDVGLSADDSVSVTIDNLGDYSPGTLTDVLISGINNKISVDASLVDDVVVAACEDTDSGVIWLSVSTDAGASFDDPLEVISDDKFKPTNPVVAYEPVERDIYLAYLWDSDGDGKKDIVLQRSTNGGADWGTLSVIDGPDPTALALDVRGDYIGLLFDAGGRDLYLAWSPDLGVHTDWFRVLSSAYARDLSLAAYGGKAYLSYVNREDELMFTSADLESGKLASELQKLATSVVGYASVAVSPDGKMVGVAFTDRYINPMVLLAESGELKFNPVERIADVRDAAYTSLTLGVESIRLAYVSAKYGLRLAASETGKYWINYTVEEGDFAYVNTAADGNGQVHIGYYDLKNRRERFAAVPFNW